MGARASRTRSGVKHLKPDGMAKDLKNIVDEVLANLRGGDFDLDVRIEDTAVKRPGFEESEVRTLSDRARTLRFEQSGFGEA